MPKNYCKYFTVSLVPTAALVLVILFAGGIIILPVLYEELATRTKYGVVLDAGSTHTDLYVYKWDIPKDSSKFTSGKIKQVSQNDEYLNSCHSLNSYTPHPSSAGQAISDCLQRSYDHVPPTEWNNTEVYLGATAGMRLVRENDSTISAEIMKAVRKTLSSSKYYFNDEQKQAQIIPGGVEAASGWTTANYAFGNFQPPDDHLVGALDMGGASTEIAFQTSSTIFPEYQASEELFGKSYTIYARSYLCYGVVEAERRFLAYLASQQSTNATIDNPCKRKGEVAVISYSYLHNQPCVRGLSALEAFGYEIILPSFLSEDQNISFNGTGNPAQCNQALNEVFNFSQCSINGTCINDSYIFAPVTGKFVAFSAFYYTADFFIEGVEDKSYTNATLQKELGNKIKDFCENKTVEAKRKYPSDIRLTDACFKGLYMLHLLENGFGFNSTTSNWELHFMMKVNDITVGWAMGYLLNITGTIPVKPYDFSRPYSSVDLVMGILVMSILCLVFVVFFILTFQACRKVVKTRSGYTDIA